MSKPAAFSWIDESRLAALACPDSLAELQWLRDQGIEVLISLTEDRLPRSWLNEAGLLWVHEPVADMEAPTQEQLDHCIQVIERAFAQNMGVAIHCAAGLGRTGTVLAAFLVKQGYTAEDAINKVRRLRPGSVETGAQEEAIEEFASRRARARREDV